MDGQKSQSKLTRTNSSLLRSSSPTIRSSIQSLSSVSEINSDQELDDIEEQKLHKPGSPPIRSGSTRILPVLALTFLSVYTLFVCSRGDDIPTSKNLLLALIFIAVALFFAGRNPIFFVQSFRSLKQLGHEYAKKLGLSSKTNSKSVQWFIGEDEKKDKKLIEKRIIREGVEFYSNIMVISIWDGRENDNSVHQVSRERHVKRLNLTTVPNRPKSPQYVNFMYEIAKN